MTNWYTPRVVFQLDGSQCQGSNCWAASGSMMLDGVTGGTVILKGGYVMSPRTEWGLKLTLDSLGNFIFRDMMAAGSLMGINPFDEPNVTESKQNTGKILEAFKSSGKLPEEAPLWEGDGVRLWADGRSAEVLNRVPLKAVESLVAAHLGQVNVTPVP